MNNSELTHARWFKSSKSDHQSACVEAAFVGESRVATRDSKQADAGPALLFGSPQWGAFVRHLGDTAH
ncbi:DUF397 domain-containing protein [Actinokineospora iranica]|uniref:DUF397 domain-containing protein n=1 Tax=Actinokineospora iranica TaxID=1271860 RepID=A0A1G6T070_9PSEU|nr:DUF397 domain-containing protein [Actinokineospora iranica]SDD22409.1 protein of unknown function [Actinokineospora iranica]